MGLQYRYGTLQEWETCAIVSFQNSVAQPKISENDYEFCTSFHARYVAPRRKRYLLCPIVKERTLDGHTVMSGALERAR